MRCIDLRRLTLSIGPGWLLALGACSPAPAPPVAAPAASAAAPAAPTASATSPASAQASSPAPSSASAKRAAALPLPPPRPVRTWAEVRRQAAHRLVAANPEGTYLGAVREPLLAIPVLEVELKRDGSVARVTVLRAPRQARDTSALAIAAVHRAAPFGDVSQLPRPWRFTETFLFDEQRRFKPRTLDE